MKVGRVKFNRMPYSIDWYAEDNFKGKGSLGTWATSLKLGYASHDYVELETTTVLELYKNSYYCTDCRKVFCEFAEKRKGLEFDG